MSHMFKLVEEAKIARKCSRESKDVERKTALDKVTKFLLQEFKIIQNPLTPISRTHILVGSPMYNAISSSLVQTCGTDWEDYLAEAVLPEGMQLYVEQRHVRVSFSYDPDKVQSD